VQAVPVVAPLREILTRLRESQGNPSSGWILRGENGGLLHVENLARREIKPILEKAKLVWHSWYSLRRGLATAAESEVKDPQGVAGMLRHKTIDVTVHKYIGIPREATERAASEFEHRYAELDKQLSAGEN